MYLQSWFLHSDLPPSPRFLGEAPWRTKGAACWGVLGGEDPSPPLPGSRQSQDKGRGGGSSRKGQELDGSPWGT